MSKRALALSILATALLLTLSPAPATADETVPQEPVSAVAAVPIQPGCGASLDLPLLATTNEGEVCSATTPVASAPEFMALARRTCRCSCGFPCSTNADCGPGGICSPGITCC